MMFTIISQRFGGFHFLVLCYYLQYLQYLQPLTNESFYTTSFALLAASACISSILQVLFHSAGAYRPTGFMNADMTLFSIHLFHSATQWQCADITVYTLYLLYTISDISSCVLTSKLLGWIVSHPSR